MATGLACHLDWLAPLPAALTTLAGLGALCGLVALDEAGHLAPVDPDVARQRQR